MQGTIDRINEVANQLQHLYRMPRKRRLARRDAGAFAFLKAELKTLWALHRKELAVIHATLPIPRERMDIDRISHEDLQVYTPATRRNLHLQQMVELLPEVLIEMKYERLLLHNMPLRELHLARGVRPIWIHD